MLVKIGEAVSRSTHNLIYIADLSFIKKYSVLFELGSQFQWKKCADFEAWLNSIVIARSKFYSAFFDNQNFEF
ncbi:hypothetical protein RHGRI_036049 [Rhododendron griersonianum]|uniref:Uncharacterized protein n=1 Tax=Rhododendron griersonianum TaxID=479676 RepID=A0AAV6HPH2_9ERIC|nr:hypothetical protein RHGRI_036049 [Rhododendron griersonianum]